MNALTLYRLAHRYQHVAMFPRLLDRLNTALTGCVIPSTCLIGHGTQLEYGGRGVKIGPHVVIGNNVHLAPFIQIDGDAVIHDHAVIGPGCHLTGPMTVQRYQEVHLSQLHTY